MATAYRNRCQALGEGTFIPAYPPPFKSTCLRITIKLTLHKAFIRSATIHTCLTSEFESDKDLMELQRLQNKVLRITGNDLRRA